MFMKTSLLHCFSATIIVGSSLLVGCSTDNSAADAQAKVDSIVNAKTTNLKLMMQRNNDSLINAKAQARADSIIAQLPSDQVKK